MPEKALANVKTASASFSRYEPNTFQISTKLERIRILKAYLSEKNSPFSDSAKTFIEEAEKNDLDWKLVVSIAGNESAFGRLIPPNSNNGWGWGVYGNHVIYFASWDEAIKVISRELKSRYVLKWGAKNVYQIGKFYASDPAWALKVSFYMADLDKFAQSNYLNTLSISL